MDQLLNTFVQTSSTPFTKAPSNEVVAISTEQNAPKINPLDKLTNTQLERYYSLAYQYGEDAALKIALSVTSHGINSWAAVSDKITMITDMRVESQEFHDLIDSSISIGKIFTIGEIIQIVATTRRLFGLKPYQKEILKCCVADFLARHMAEVKMSVVAKGSKDKPKLMGYKPTFNLNCQL